jgi:molybdate transport system substrate-binding protein
MSIPESAQEPEAAVTLTVPPVDVIEDLHGDPLMAELVLFLNGNQFMVMEELLTVFRTLHPTIRRIFYETLPPGILVEQVRRGRLRIGSLELSIAPDVLTAGPDQLSILHGEGWVGTPTLYASNDLSILVAPGNPAGIHGLSDLGRSHVRVAMPNPATEGVGKLIVTGLRSAGGEPLVRRVMEEKVATGETRLTQIHHRESVLWLAHGEVDVAPLWSTEARYHVQRGTAEEVAIEKAHNQLGHYAVAVVERRSLHPAAAALFVQFMQTAPAQKVYARYGFAPPSPGGL